MPFDESVYVTGMPELALNTGEDAQYAGGSGTSTLTFQYVVQPGDSSPALDYTGNYPILLNGGTIDDSSGGAVSLFLSSPGSGPSLSGYETLDINTMAPVVSNITAIGPATITGGVAQFAVTFSKPVYNVGATDFSLAGSGVTGDIAYVTGGGAQYVVTVDNVSGTGTLGLNLADNSAIVDAGGNLLSGTFSSGPVFLVVAGLPGTLTGGALTGAAYVPASGMLASFTDTRGLGYTASQYLAQVYWGDGSESSEPVTFNSTTQQFEIDGGHTYTVMGNYTVQVQVSDPNGLMAIIDAPAVIADAPLTAVAFTPPPMVEHTVDSNVQVLHFTDADPNATASEFSAVISWGDGSTDTVTGAAGQIVADPNGGFDVFGTHGYGAPQSGITFSVTVTDAGGATCSASESGLSVADAPLIDPTLLPPQSATLSGVPIFTFVDTAGLMFLDFSRTAYTATVYWGDGPQDFTTYTNTSTNSPFAEPHHRGDYPLWHSHLFVAAYGHFQRCRHRSGRLNCRLERHAPRGYRYFVLEQPDCGGGEHTAIQRQLQRAGSGCHDK